MSGATGYLAGGQVAPRRAVKINSAGKVVHTAAGDATGTVVGSSPAIGITQAAGRGAPGTPWASVWTGASTPALTQNVTPIAADLDQEVQVFDKDGQECEAECATPASGDIDTGAGVLTAGGPIVYGDKLTFGPDGVLFKLQGAGYYLAIALFDAVQVTPFDTTDDMVIGMVRIEKGYRAA